MANLTTTLCDIANASATSSAAAFCSATTSFPHYDVFINHRGPDSKKTFVSHLYRRLISSGLRVFLDREELVEGGNLDCQIKAAISVASVQVAVFSPTYAESKWCLDELVHMVDSRATILPVFYNVKPHVLRHTVKHGAYAEALLNHQQKTTTDPQTGQEQPRYQPETIKKWRNALAHVADISGFELNGDEGELLDKVVQSILKNVPKTPLYVAKYPTGLDLKVQEFETTVLSEQWETERSEAKVVGIVGVGGAGKTTLAKHFFNHKRSYYSASSFLFDVREDAARMSLNYLQSKLLKDLKQTDIMIGQDEGIGILKKHLSSSHALIVLDDVDHVCQLEAFLPIKDILRPTSLILITSRDKHVLKSSGILESSIYDLEGLDRPLSRELFCSYAFHHPLPPKKFADLVDRFVTACNGLPLSLKVFGALVCGENDERYWEEQLDRLQQTLPVEILERLRISYDSLSKQDRPIFLDIASFFIGEDRDTAIRIWGTVGIQNLENKCLLEVGSKNEIKMHDHIRELGRNIAAEEGSMPLRLGGRTTNEIDDLLDQSSCRTREVCGITMVDRLKFNRHKLCVSRRRSEIRPCHFVTDDGSEPLRGGFYVSTSIELGFEPISGMSSEMSLHMSSDMSWYKKWSDEVFGNCMRNLVNNSPSCGILNLRLVATEDGYLERILKRARSPHLLWLRWYKCPYSSLPSWIPMENLRVLEVAGLKLKLLWDRESQVPFQLRELNIFAPLSSIPKSIGQLKLLEKIVIVHALLKTLPDEFCNLRFLKFLELRDCSRMMSLPESFGKLTNLQHIDFSCASALQMLPLSFGKLIRLKHLDLKNCANLIISSGTHGNMTMLDYLDLSSITTLEYIDLSGCKKVNELPSGIGDLYNLGTLKLGSDSLKVLPFSLGFLESLTYLSLHDLPILKCLPESIGLLTKLKELYICKCGIEYLPYDLMKLNNLEILRVEECPLLELPFKNVEREREKLMLVNNKLDSSNDRCMLGLKQLWLRCLKIREVAFPTGVCPNLQVLSLFGCEELRQIAGLCGLAELQSLRITDCANVENLPSFERLISLEELTVCLCQRLRSITGLGQLTKLRRLFVFSCEEMQNLTTAEHLAELNIGSVNLTSIEGLGQLTKLRLLKVYDCPNIRRLPGVQHLVSLEELYIYSCRDLKSIQGLGHLTKLRRLHVTGCRKIQKLPGVEQCSSLEEFVVRDCPNLQWGEGVQEHLQWGEGVQKDSFVDESDDDMPELEEQFGPSSTAPKVPEETASDEEIVESEVELDNEGVIEPDNDPPQKMGDPSIEVTDEKRDEAQMAKSKGMEAMADGDLDEAVNHLTEAIECNPTSAIIYATRASVFVKMKKPNAAIRDANAAIKINPDSAKGYKWRGMARAMLGHWEEAAKDLHLASRLDYDEEISAVLKKVEPNVHKIEDHHRKYERLRREKDERKKERERQHRRAEAQAAYEKAKKQEKTSTCKPCGATGGCSDSGCSGGMPGGFPGGMPAGGMPGGFPGGMPGGFPGGMPGDVDMSNILNDPELMAAFSDPDVMTALQDVMKNPANLAKYQANPKIAPVIAKMMGKFAGK